MRHVVRPFPWWSLAHLALGIVMVPVVAVVLFALAATAPLAVFVATPFLLVARLFAWLLAFDRARFAVFLNRDVGQPLTPPHRGLSAHDRVRMIMADPVHQRAAGYAIVRVALAFLQLVAIHYLLLLPIIALAGLGVSAIVDYQPWLRSGFFSDPFAVVTRVPLIVGLLALGAPHLVAGLAALDTWVTRTLLGTPGAEELEQRVGELVAARARTVSAADAERTKLERDLHDGAQQRLIALSVLLGQAEAQLLDAAGAPRAGDAEVEDRRAGGAATRGNTTSAVPRASTFGQGSDVTSGGTPSAGAVDQAVLALVRRARAETAETIDELRTLTRGLRPPILEARGLDAALSAVASRLPMRVTIDARLDGRLDPALEAIVYFAVTEALTNVAKHAGGAAASVELVREGDRLRATVADDGPGGADVTGGTGLSGIADRLSGVDGRLFLSSPPGGPTVVTVEVPCA